MPIKKFTQHLNERLQNEEDARACKAIDERACRVVPGNYFLTLISYFFNTLADSIANAKVIIPWIMQTLNAPIFLISFLVPIRESGAMLPQLFIGAYIRQKPIRKWVWVFGAVLQALSMCGIALVAYTLEGMVAGYAIIALLLLFSLARGLSSVAAKDVLGKTIPKKRRGKLTGISSSFAGLVVIVLGAYLLLVGEKPFSPENFAVLLCLAGFCWILAAFFYGNITEYPGETEGGGNAAAIAIKKISLLKTDKMFRLFVISRALFLSSVLSAPFFIILAQEYTNSNTYLLGFFILANGLSALLSAPFWGNFADLSSRKVMIVGAMITSVLGVVLFCIDLTAPHWFANIWFMPVLYFFLSIGYHGIRVGRKTYVVDMAEGNKRTDYVSVSNTLIGFILLLTGFVGSLNAIMSISSIILTLSIVGFIGVYLTYKLPEVQEEE